jgi:MoaA/NifB/PqqE/SkfB family radical SAM enzyme
MDIYSLRIKHNLYEDVVLSMPCGAYFRNTDYDITLTEKRDLYQKIYRFNIEHNIPFDTISPFIGGLGCTQLGNGLYITNCGHVYHCPGSFEKLGNVKYTSLKEIWNGFTQKSEYSKSYFCPFREKANIIPTELVEDMRLEFCINDPAMRTK